MNVRSFDALTVGELDTWEELRAGNPALDSPYFHPGFSAAVHAAGRTVHVAVGDGVFVPHHRDGRLLRPVGWPGADFQGPILAAGAPFRPLDLLGNGAGGYAFDHLIEQAPGFERWVVTRRPSPYLDVSGGLDGYLGRASKSGKDNMGQARRRLARAARELGEVRFEADSCDAEALARVIELKRAQYAATGAQDYFAEPERVRLLESLLKTRDPGFGGVLSTVHAGPRLLAAHFGLRSGGVLHWWFPVYDPELAKLSPGWILLRELVAAAPALGVSRIDLGRGEDEYKRRAKTGESVVCQGIVTRNPLRRAAVTALARAREMARNGRLPRSR
ncbi:CelD/BcsL family acetyltransferase involved in cellulose biosynthesis [Nonomuraea thailandensis]|uniref:CelD/BcsL family acetyltransferase involved in cellulose biosynthesis n=1 Tax=Nonomuraea thailandensis TaxID=1188745 RepID=A0A9X2GRW1_9ACTN|nr:GNAT family N-acetyltransferase [Nonomuraea thailandensis]MCP2362672.1 CelD/BcsL family acetyltransferase involved in cellulose biosynthesis [Nonomuraea thailandensis]